MRKRIVYPYRQILAKDVNDISDNVEVTFQTFTKDILGVSSGVVSGFDNSQLLADTVRIFPGTYSDGSGTFYELLNYADIVVNGSAGTKRIYGLIGESETEPVSGYVLLDVSTQTETFSEVNSIVYDSVTIGINTSIPASGFPICDVDWNGSSIVAITDVRQVCTFFNSLPLSLQAQYIGSNNTVNVGGGGFVTGQVGKDVDLSTKVAFSAIIDENNNGIGYYAQNNSNLNGGVGYLMDSDQSFGFYANVTGRVNTLSNGFGTGFYSNQTNNYGIGYYGKGYDSNYDSGTTPLTQYTNFFSTFSDNGFYAKGNLFGFRAYVRNNQGGFIATGNNSSTSGFISEGLESGFYGRGNKYNFESFVESSSTSGFIAIGSSSTDTVGYVSKNLQYGFVAETPSLRTGFRATGAGFGFVAEDISGSNVLGGFVGINNDYTVQANNSQTAIEIINGVASKAHFNITPFTTLPSSPITDDIILFKTGGAYSLKVYDGTQWRSITFS